MDDRGNRIVALSDKTVQDIKKIRIQFTDETTPLIYNITYIDTRENIASYKVAQIPVHFNFRNYVVSTTTTQFNKLLTAAKGYDFDGDIETRVSQKTALLYCRYTGKIITMLSNQRWSRCLFPWRHQIRSIR